MADFGTLFPARFANILAKYADAEGATVSAQIDADAEITSVDVKLSVSGEDGQTVLSTQADAEINGATISATSDAAGETASTSVDFNVTREEESTVAKTTATAEATGDDATASTDVEASPEFEVVEFQQDTTETPDDGTLTVDSRTYFEGTLEGVSNEEGFWNEPLAFEVLPTDESVLVDTGIVDDLLLG